MSNYFIFKGKSSSNLDIVIQCEDMPSISSPEEDVELIQIPGRDGYLTVSNRRKKSVTKELRCTLINEDNKKEVYDWLNGEGDLTLSNDDEVFYKARIVNVPEFVYHWSEGWQFSVIFECQPYGYLHTGNSPIPITSQNTKLFNNNAVAKPYIEIVGTGIIGLIINGVRIEFTGSIIIDSELLASWYNIYEKSFKGDFPLFEKGENTISWTGNVSKIEVTPRWRR